jgi:hypothetical protein
VFLFERAVGRRVHRENPPIPGGFELSGPAVTADTLVVDVAPKIAVVLGVGDGDLFTWLVHGVACQI